VSLANRPVGVEGPPGEGLIVAARVVQRRTECVLAPWTTPSQLREWWGPGRLETALCGVDLRVGGAWRIVEWDTQRVELAHPPWRTTQSPPEAGPD